MSDSDRLPLSGFARQRQCIRRQFECSSSDRIVNRSLDQVLKLLLPPRSVRHRTEPLNFDSDLAGSGRTSGGGPIGIPAPCVRPRPGQRRSRHRSNESLLVILLVGLIARGVGGVISCRGPGSASSTTWSSALSGPLPAKHSSSRRDHRRDHQSHARRLTATSSSSDSSGVTAAGAVVGAAAGVVDAAAAGSPRAEEG